MAVEEKYKRDCVSLEGRVVFYAYNINLNVAKFEQWQLATCVRSKVKYLMDLPNQTLQTVSNMYTLFIIPLHTPRNSLGHFKLANLFKQMINLNK